MRTRPPHGCTDRGSPGPPSSFGDDGFLVTDDGIWVPTPLGVVDAMLAALGERGWWTPREDGGRTTCLDAGMGDGRLVAALGRLGPHIHAVGIESHDALYQRALEHLSGLPSSGWSATRGSYLEPGTYAALGLTTHAIDLVFNYPDGNERALVQFWRTRGRPGSRLVFCSPDHSLTFPELAVECVLPTVRGFRVHVARV